ncbi:MAG: hypothetical protein ACTSP6_10710 [Promethearchaeota archaeon]
MPITPLILKGLSVIECPKHKNKVEISICYKCLYCTRIEDTGMIRRVFCVYSEKEEGKEE